MTIRFEDLVILTIDHTYNNGRDLYRVRFGRLSHEMKEMLIDFYPEEPLREFGWTSGDTWVAITAGLPVVHRNLAAEEIANADYVASVGYKIRGYDAGREEYIGLICPIEGDEEGRWLGYYFYDEWWDEGSGAFGAYVLMDRGTYESYAQAWEDCDCPYFLCEKEEFRADSWPE